jgi:hypothetical protein
VGLFSQCFVRLCIHVCDFLRTRSSSV